MVGLHSGRVGSSYNMPRAFYDLYIIIVYTVVIQWSLPSSSALSCPKQLPTELFTLDFIDWEEPWTNWMMMQQFQNSISGTMGLNYFFMHILTDYGCLVRKSPSLHNRKSTPTLKFLGTTEAYFVCHMGPNFQISLIYAFIGCP